MLGWLTQWWGAKAALVEVYCDGSAHERAGRPGGWAFVVLRGGALLAQGSGAQASTTNNAMELEAALRAMRAVVARGWYQRHAVELISDSRLTLEVANGGEVPKMHLTEGLALRQLCVEAKVTTRWVRAHAGNRWNEHVDAMAHRAKQTLVPERVKRRRARH